MRAAICFVFAYYRGAAKSRFFSFLIFLQNLWDLIFQTRILCLSLFLADYKKKWDISLRDNKRCNNLWTRGYSNV